MKTLRFVLVLATPSLAMGATLCTPRGSHTMVALPSSSETNQEGSPTASKPLAPSPTDQSRPGTYDTTPPQTKLGLAYNNPKLTRAFAGKASWAYNWDSQPSGDLPHGVTFFPMFWNASASHAKPWAKNVENALSNLGSTHLLFINEPDLDSQGATSPQDAATQWMKYMQPYADRATLVSPAITNGGSKTMGIGWMDAFLGECEKLGCTVHAIAAHIYSSAENVQGYKDHISKLGKYGRPVLMTEIGVSAGSVEQEAALIRELVPWMDGQDYVTHHAWFMCTDGEKGLVKDDGTLSSLGEAYVG